MRGNAAPGIRPYAMPVAIEAMHRPMHSKIFQSHITFPSTASYGRSVGAFPRRSTSLGGFMSSPYVLAAVIAVFLSLGIAIAYFVWHRRSGGTPPSAPPAGAATPALAAPPARYPFDDEWEAYAPYPDHALHAIRPEETASRHASSFDTRARSRGPFEFDDVEPFDLDDSPPFAAPTGMRRAIATAFRSHRTPHSICIRRRRTRLRRAAHTAVHRASKRSTSRARRAARSAASPALRAVWRWRCPARKPERPSARSVAPSAQCSVDWPVR